MGKEQNESKLNWEKMIYVYRQLVSLIGTTHAVFESVEGKSFKDALDRFNKKFDTSTNKYFQTFDILKGIVPLDHILDIEEMFKRPDYEPPTDLFGVCKHLFCLFAYYLGAGFRKTKTKEILQVDFAMTKIIREAAMLKTSFDYKGHREGDRTLSSTKGTRKNIAPIRQRAIEEFYKLPKESETWKPHHICTEIVEFENLGTPFRFPYLRFYLADSLWSGQVSPLVQRLRLHQTGTY